jgi:exonuclease VII large subunit
VRSEQPVAERFSPLPIGYPLEYSCSQPLNLKNLPNTSNMDESKTSLLLKRPVNIKAIVTPRWKEEVQQQLQAQINNIDAQLQQLELQGQRAIAEIQKQSLQPPSAQVMQQIENIQIQVNQQKSELLEQKNQQLQQLQQVQMLELDQEVNQGQMESYFRVERGDNLVRKMNVEILLRDGVVEEIRGDI